MCFYLPETVNIALGWASIWNSVRWGSLFFSGGSAPFSVLIEPLSFKYANSIHQKNTF
jgi:hypothetical protein